MNKHTLLGLVAALFLLPTAYADDEFPYLSSADVSVAPGLLAPGCWEWYPLAFGRGASGYESTILFNSLENTQIRACGWTSGVISETCVVINVPRLTLQQITMNQIGIQPGTIGSVYIEVTGTTGFGASSMVTFSGVSFAITDPYWSCP